MFCPACGAKNDNPGTSCFVCGQPLPSGGVAATGATTSSARRASRTNRPKTQTLQLGSVGDRALALLADRILLLALIILLFSWFGGGWLFDGSVFGSGTAIALSSLGFFLIIFLYHFLMELIAGTTAGKILFGLRVINEGERSAAAAFAIRNALRILDGLALNLVGGLVAYFDQRVRRIGDLVGGTVVVQTPLKTSEKAALLITFLLVIGGALWLGTFLCPHCPGELQGAIHSAITP